MAYGRAALTPDLVRRAGIMMRHGAIIICLIVYPLPVATRVLAQESADQLRAIEHERLRSLVDADMPTARRYHADDFQLVNPDGGTMSKEQYLGRVADASLDYIEWEPEEIRLRLYGDAAVIRYRAHLRVSVKGVQGAMSISGTRISTKSEVASGKLFGRTPLLSKSEAYARQLRLYNNSLQLTKSAQATANGWCEPSTTRRSHLESRVWTSVESSQQAAQQWVETHEAGPCIEPRRLTQCWADRKGAGEAHRIPGGAEEIQS